MLQYRYFHLFPYVKLLCHLITRKYLKIYESKQPSSACYSSVAYNDKRWIKPKKVWKDFFINSANLSMNHSNAGKFNISEFLKYKKDNINVTKHICFLYFKISLLTNGQRFQVQPCCFFKGKTSLGVIVEL